MKWKCSEALIHVLEMQTEFYMITAPVIHITPFPNITATAAQTAEQQHNPWSLIHANWYGYQPALICCINDDDDSAPFGQRVAELQSRPALKQPSNESPDV